jgi:hypothetical protein
MTVSKREHGPFVPGAEDRTSRGWPKDDTCSRCGYLLGSEEYGEEAPQCAGPQTVAELMAVLEQHDPQARVVGTWEGVFAEIHVYEGADGTVLLDVDGESYKDRFQQDGWRCRMVTR